MATEGGWVTTEIGLIVPASPDPFVTPDESVLKGCQECGAMDGLRAGVMSCGHTLFGCLPCLRAVRFECLECSGVRCQDCGKGMKRALVMGGHHWVCGHPRTHTCPECRAKDMAGADGNSVKYRSHSACPVCGEQCAYT